MNILSIVAFVACFCIAVVLGKGLLNMARGGSSNTSQRLMRWRVILQALAIALVLFIIYIKS